MRIFTKKSSGDNDVRSKGLTMKKLLATLILFAMSTSSYGMVIYQNDFEGGDTAGWSGGEIVDGVYVQVYDEGTRKCTFFGCFTFGAGFDDLKFKNENPAYVGSVDLMFDVITYGDWEQSGEYEDEFGAIAKIWGLFNDETIYEGTLQDGVNTLMFNDVPLYGGPEWLGGNPNLLSLKFEADVSSETKEYFGIDNFKVIASQVLPSQALPEPGTLAIFLMGLAGVAVARRRA